jgi:hypothetical protein
MIVETAAPWIDAERLNARELLGSARCMILRRLGLRHEYSSLPSARRAAATAIVRDN